jgi:hypothetical protein
LHWVKASLPIGWRWLADIDRLALPIQVPKRGSRACPVCYVRPGDPVSEADDNVICQPALLKALRHHAQACE